MIAFPVTSCGEEYLSREIKIVEQVGKRAFRIWISNTPKASEAISKLW